MFRINHKILIRFNVALLLIFCSFFISQKALSNNYYIGMYQLTMNYKGVLFVISTAFGGFRKKNECDSAVGQQAEIFFQGLSGTGIHGKVDAAFCDLKPPPYSAWELLVSGKRAPHWILNYSDATSGGGWMRSMFAVPNREMGKALCEAMRSAAFASVGAMPNCVAPN